MLVSIYRIRTLERNYPNPAVISQCSFTVLTKTMLIISCRMFSRCHDSEDYNRTHCKTFSCVRQLTRLVVLVLSRGHCDCYTHSMYILILISAEPLILTHRTQFKNHWLSGLSARLAVGMHRIYMAVAILSSSAFYPWRLFCRKTSLIGQLVIVIARRSRFATYSFFIIF